MDVQRQDEELPQCKIKRNYSCNHCTYFTQNPRFYLTHLRDIHGERIVINKCNLCLYASRHYQKLVRHMKMVHGSTEGIIGQSRKRASPEDSAWYQQPKKPPTPPLLPLLYPIETTIINTANLSNDLELSRNSLKDIAALYFAENQIDKIMTQMEAADAVELPPPPDDITVTVKRQISGNSFFDELKKTFVEEENLTCQCGHVSKYLSESIIHRKSCCYSNEKIHRDGVPIINFSSGSTRCQHCRRRCKSSVDLMTHLKNCSQVEHSTNEYSNSGLNGDGEGQELGDCSISLSTENRVFVWNEAPTVARITVPDHCADVKVDMEVNHKTPQDTNEESKQDNIYFGLETATGYGEVTKKMTPEEEATNLSLKKVFKCPRCSFWASTASRFHVHIVGHLNKKPFKCSLCAYRSNWRWDITKHIRLKTLRNLNHKNARVLMNDETGRRNYTKYNKYITLIEVTEEDGDPRLIKSGEMTPNQVASLAFLNDLNKEISESSELADDDSQQLNEKNLTTDADDGSCINELEELKPQGGIKRNKTPLIKLGDDLIVDINTKGLKNEIVFKCRRCNFRHANRDAAQAHIRIHYHDSAMCPPSPSKSNLSTPRQAVVNSTNLYMDNVFAAAICLSQKQLLQNQKSPIDSNNNQHSIQRQSQKDTSSIKVTDPLQSNVENSHVVNANSTFPSTAPTTASTARDGPSSFTGGAGKSTILMGVAAGSNFVNDISERKEPSPFRCGHCHQVSNWKHVIQRHCRLKHSGFIRIEAFDRNSNGHVPVYRPLDFYGNPQSHDLPSDNYKPEVLKVNQQHEQQMQHKTSIINNSKPNKSSVEQRPSSASSSNSEHNLLPNEPDVNQLSIKSSPPFKHFQCLSCPYVADSTTQLNVHLSLHKPNQYECSNVCTKKQHASNQVKTDDTPPPTNSPDGKQPHPIPTIKIISYCPKCPEKFTNSAKKLQQHLKSHGANLDFKCDVCDFSAKQKAILLCHSFLHTSKYQEKSEHIIKDCKEDSECPAKQSQEITLPKTDVSTCVMDESQKQSVDADVCMLDEQRQTVSPKNTATSTSTSSPASENRVQEKCTYCPFQSSCSNDLQRHLQHHIRISNHPEQHTCEHCDFSTASETIYDKHIQIHFKAIENKKSVQFFTSYDKLELIVTDDNENKDKGSPLSKNKVVQFKSDSNVEKPSEKTDEKLTLNLRRSRRSSALKFEKKSSPPPPLPSHKTILVNPKTGQVIRRN